MDVFANSQFGNLNERTLTPASQGTWSLVGSGLPGNFTGSPYPVYDQALSRNEIYDNTSTGTISLVYGGSGPASSWTGSYQFSSFTAQGNPAPVDDPVNNQMDVFATSVVGALEVNTRPASGSNWTGWTLVGGGLPTDFNRSPVAVYDPVLSRMEVYDTEANGTIWLACGNNVSPGSWTCSHSFTTLSAIGRPTALVDQVSTNNQMDLFATNDRGTLQENYHTASGNWSGWITVGPSASQTGNGSPFAIYDAGLGRNEVFFTAPGNQLEFAYGGDSNSAYWPGLYAFSASLAAM